MARAAILWRAEMGSQTSAHICALAELHLNPWEFRNHDINAYKLGGIKLELQKFVAGNFEWFAPFKDRFIVSVGWQISLVPQLTKPFLGCQPWATIPSNFRSLGPSFSLLHDRASAWKEGAEGDIMAVVTVVTVAFFLGGVRNGKGKDSRWFLALWL